jgi:hypothetical protein
MIKKVWVYGCDEKGMGKWIYLKNSYFKDLYLIQYQQYEKTDFCVLRC